MEGNIIRRVREREFWISVDNLYLGVILFGHNGKPSDGQENRSRGFHTHSYVELFVCVEESATVVTPAGELKIYRNDVLFIPSDYPHYATAVGEGLVTLGIYGKRIDSKSEYDLYGDLSSVLELGGARVYRATDEICRGLVEIASVEETRDSPYPSLRLVLIMRELLRWGYVSVSEELGTTATGANERDITRILAIEHIISHYTEPYDPRGVAERLYITRRHLDRIVKERYGKTLRELIYERRIEHAKRLLENSGETVEKIALRVGFSGAQSFKNAFLNIVGVTPREYRANLDKRG